MTPIIFILKLFGDLFSDSSPESLLKHKLLIDIFSSHYFVFDHISAFTAQNVRILCTASPGPEIKREQLYFLAIQCASKSFYTFQDICKLHLEFEVLQ